MKSRLLGAVCVLSLVFSIPAHAATVNGSGGVATSIDNLIIGSTTYNVTFTNLGNPPGNSFNDVFSTIPTFWGDGTDATDAMTAINAVLNGGPWLNVGSPDNDNDYLIPFQDVGTDSVKSARGAIRLEPDLRIHLWLVVG